jgi:hypothetical protein
VTRSNVVNQSMWNNSSTFWNSNLLRVTDPRSVLVALATFLAINISPAQDKPANYEDQVTPVLRNHCFKCHNPDKNKADLDLTSYNGAMKGSSSGAVLKPGDPSASKTLPCDHSR